MLDLIQPFANGLGLITASMAAGAVWVAAIASPNCSFDRLDNTRADGHVRTLLKATTIPTGVLMLLAAAGFGLGGSLAAAITSAAAGFGFFINLAMLAPRKGKPRVGMKTSRKDQRVYSVAFMLMFGAVTLAAIALGLIGI